MDLDARVKRSAGMPFIEPFGLQLVCTRHQFDFHEPLRVTVELDGGSNFGMIQPRLPAYLFNHSQSPSPLTIENSCQR